MESDGKNLTMERDSKKNKALQRIPLQDTEVQLPTLAKNFCKQTRIQRDVFLNGIEKVGIKIQESI